MMKLKITVLFLTLFLFLHKIEAQNLNATAKSIQGSWGARLYVRGGEVLNEYVDKRKYNYLAGAKEIIKSYPTMGHVITNATNNSLSHLWTLRSNPNVDKVTGKKNFIIHKEFVPSAKNEKVIMDVIKEFKKGKKKVFLYLNTLSPAERSSAAATRAWNSYVKKYFKGDEHKAWMNYCEGYIKRFAELKVDGYWLDAFNSYPGNDTERAQFIKMIRKVDSKVAITANFDKDFFKDKKGNNILVDTDGVNDKDKRDYRIIKMTATNAWSDFTAGHITPLDNGAPPNSWAYEEFTVADIQDSPTTTYKKSIKAVKHLFLPIRAKWSSENEKLMFDGTQAYRFVKRITDAGGAVTFSTTTDKDGTTMEDEEKVLKFVDKQLAKNAAATKYKRPKGAYLVGEKKSKKSSSDKQSLTPLNDAVIDGVSNQLDNLALKIYPNPVTNYFEMSKAFNNVSVYSITGQKLLEFSGNKSSFDISKLNTGLYLLKAYDDEGHGEVIRFVKK